MRGVVRDVLVLGGLSLVAGGAWAVDWRLALILIGTMLIWFGVFLPRRG